ncbi:hypothetical protein BC831DRAFT_475438 [Entophlyctis helioformis]|nr:hypothetical protein BC831DRAFT_475438 [Entophlyctis helioformis]
MLSVLPLVAALSSTPQAAPKRLCDNAANPTICIVTTPAANGSVAFTVHSKATGWTGIGFGATMRNVPMFVGWDGPSAPVVSTRFSTGYSLPAVANPTGARAVALAVPAPAWVGAGISFSFEVPQAAFNRDTAFLWATSNTRPSTPASPSPAPSPPAPPPAAEQPPATSAPTFSPTPSPSATPLSEAGGMIAIPSGMTYETLILIHGVVMFIAWGLAPFIGIAASRYFKRQLGDWASVINVIALAVLCGLGTLGGMLVIALFKSGPAIGNDIHSIVGMAMLVMLFIQAVLGFVVHWMHDEYRHDRPWYNVAYAILGVVLIVAGLVNMFLGVASQEHLGYAVSPYVSIGLGIVVAIVITLVLFAEIQHRHDKKNKESMHVVYLR